METVVLDGNQFDLLCATIIVCFGVLCAVLGFCHGWKGE